MWKPFSTVYGLYKPRSSVRQEEGKTVKKAPQKGVRDGSKKGGSVIYYYRVFYTAGSVPARARGKYPA